MPFKLLKKVILHLRKTAKCPSCGGSFTENNILILATAAQLKGDGFSGLFVAECSKCDTQSFVVAQAQNATAKNEDELINLQTSQSKRNISANDILDMHNLLKDYRGDLSELLK